MCKEAQNDQFPYGMGSWLWATLSSGSHPPQRGQDLLFRLQRTEVFLVGPWISSSMRRILSNMSKW